MNTTNSEHPSKTALTRKEFLKEARDPKTGRFMSLVLRKFHRLSYLNYFRDYFSKYYTYFDALKGFLFLSYRDIASRRIDISRSYIIKVNEVKLLTIPYDKGISLELVVFGVHEPLSTLVLKKELRRNWTCIDIGANLGYYALLESRLVGNQGKVLAIEPNPVAYKYLRKNIALNKATNIETYKVAMGHYDGTAYFLVDERSNLSRIVADNNTHRNTIQVPLTTLDKFISDNKISKLDFLRMDVEGYEAHILKGGVTTIKKYHPDLYIEFHKGIIGIDATMDLLYELANMGYDIKYYIPREVDLAILANSKYIIRTKLGVFIKMLLMKKVPDYFHLYLSAR